MSLSNDEPAGDAPDRWHDSIPDLKDLFDKQILAYLLNATFRGRGPRKHPAVALTVQFVTLTDKATYEYKQGRAELVRFLDRPPQSNLISPIFRASDHFETCVTTLYRASRFLVKVAGCRDAPTVVREDRRYVENVRKRLKDVRDAIEHMEEQLLAEAIAEGEAVSLFPNEQGLEVGSFRITFVELAGWITRFHRLAKDLTDAPPPAQKEEESPPGDDAGSPGGEDSPHVS